MRLKELREIKTVMGQMTVAATEQGVCFLEFSDRKDIEHQFVDLCKFLPGSMQKSKHINDLEIQLKEYFSGKRKKFTVPVLSPSSDFYNSLVQAGENGGIRGCYGWSRQRRAISGADSNPL